MASKRKTAARKGPKAARAKTAAQKPAKAKAGARRKPPRRGREIEPKASGTLGIRGSRSRGARELDLAIKPTTTLGGGLTRAARETAPATLGLPGVCLPLTDAATIVLEVAGPGSFSRSLEAAGFLGPTQRTQFRADVRKAVQNAGCDIDAAEIPNGASTKLSEVRDAIQSRAR